MTTIELGEIGRSPSYEPRPGTDRRLVRRIGLIVAVALLLFGVAASGLPEQPGLRPLWSVPMAEPDGMMLNGETAYLTRTTDGRTRLTAYDLATGGQRWEVWLDGTTGETQLYEPAGLILTSADRQATSTDGMFVEFHRTTVALDARTGRRAWTAPGQAMTVTSDSALMADFDDRGLIERYRLIRLADRSTVWTREAPVYVYGFSTAAGRPDRLVTATWDGTVEVIRLADGYRTARERISWVEPKPEENQFDDVTVSGDYLVVNRNRQDRADISVYRLDTLAEVWREADTKGYAFACGPSLCTNDGDNLAAYDLRTGRQQWLWSGVSNGWAATDDRLVADEGGPGSLFLIDAASGEPIGDRVRGTTVWAMEPDGAIYLMNPTADPPGRTSITKWDLATGRSRLLGSVAALTGYRCEIEHRFLACQRQERFEVTAVD
jgi:outer membrane protein assembly factor BamB